MTKANKQIPLTTNTLFKCTPRQVADFLEENYTFRIPMHLDTPDEMRLASELTAQIVNTYSYLLSLDTSLRIMIATVSGYGKDAADEVDALKLKQKAISNKTSALKCQYQALSRILTIKQEINKELSMSEHKSFEK